MARSEEFYLSRGGPYYRLMTWMKLAHPPSRYTFRRAIFLALLTWLPLLILCWIEGTAVRTVRVPFLYDYINYSRFLLAIPLFTLAEISIDLRLNQITCFFTENELVRTKDHSKYIEILHKAKHLCDSAPIEAAIIGIIYLSAVYQSNFDLNPSVLSWRSTGVIGELSMAGWWYTIISLPIYQFIMFRWAWRLIVWTWVLRRISRLDLNLIVTHPDLAGGIGFLSIGQSAFWMLILGISWVITSIYASRILYEGTPFSALELPLIGMALLILIIILGPLSLFTPLMIRAKIEGLFKYSRLALQYTRSFDRKWVVGENPGGETLLGTSDIQSLADLYNSFEVIRKMKIVPISLQSVVLLVMVILIPMLAGLFVIQPVVTALKLITRVTGKLLGLG